MLSLKSEACAIFIRGKCLVNVTLYDFYKIFKVSFIVTNILKKFETAVLFSSSRHWAVLHLEIVN